MSHRSTPFWLWPNVLALDAVAVALAWQALFARTFGVPLGWEHGAVLGLSVWLAYAADRWMDGWRFPAGGVRTARHRFWVGRRRTGLAVWLLVLALALGTAWFGLRPDELFSGCALLAPCLLYAALVQRRGGPRPPKEGLAAVLFTAGVFIFIRPLPAGDPGTPAGAWWLAAAVFAGLCFANCCLVAIGEREVDRLHGEDSIALRRPGTERGFPLLAIVPAASGLALAGWLPGGPRAAAALALAAGGLLAAFYLRRTRWARTPGGLATAADVALLSPLLFLW